MLDLDRTLAAADPAVRLRLQQEIRTYNRVTPVGRVHRRLILTVPVEDKLVNLTEKREAKR